MRVASTPCTGRAGFSGAVLGLAAFTGIHAVKLAARMTFSGSFAGAG
jgi:hypothetical protein